MSERDESSVWRWVEGAAVVLVLGFFLYSMRDLLNPVVLFLLLWAVLAPFQGKRGRLALLAVAGTVTLYWLLTSTGSLLAPFILAIVLAYVLDPLVDRLERRRVSRSVAIAMLIAVAGTLLGGAVVVAVPAAVAQLGSVVEEVPQFVQRVGGWVETVRNRGIGSDIPVVAELLARLERIDAAAVVAFLQERGQELAAWVWDRALGLGRGMRSVVTVVGYVALTPILTFYLLRDWDRLIGLSTRLIPNDRRDTVVAFGRECDALVSRYLRGQVTVSLVLGAITGLGLWIVSFPQAGLLALIVAVFNVVPYLGLILSLIPALFLALVSGSVGLSLVKVAAVYGVAQLLEGSVISPRIVGESVGLHPVTVLLALSLGGFFFGLVGLLVAVPAAAVGRLAVARALARYEASAFYRGPSTETAP
jgi:predicted PurR-regulated permease PerM